MSNPTIDRIKDQIVRTTVAYNVALCAAEIDDQKVNRIECALTALGGEYRLETAAADYRRRWRDGRPEVPE